MSSVISKIKIMRQRLNEVRNLAQLCKLCPRQCKVNRLDGEIGECRIVYGPIYSSANLHYGEEPPISGSRGSGTIFLTSCNLHCKYCQNFPISQLRNGIVTTPEGLAKQMLILQDYGAHNINFVTPTAQAAAIFESLLIAYENGLNIPIVYNCGGYESLEMLKLWDGIIDIYMPDIKYSDDKVAFELSQVKDYVKHNRLAIKEMYRQVGTLVLDEQGIAVRGLLVRHLVLPENLSGTFENLKFIAEEISPNTYISLMSQYFPAYLAHNDARIARKITATEYRKACETLDRFGLKNGWIQPF